MRILLVNWAPLPKGAAQGGGVNGYAQALALAFVAAGHEVIALSGGTSFERAAGSRDPGPPRIERRPDWRVVACHEVVNSPVLAPSIHQFADPMGEVSHAGLERLAEAFAASVRPDVIHLHNIEGFTAGCAGALRRGAGGRAALVYSLHNYHTVCPQVYLLRRGRLPCHDFENGRACERCLEAPDPGLVRRRIMAGHRPDERVFGFLPEGVRRAFWRMPLAHPAARAIKALVRRGSPAGPRVDPAEWRRLIWTPLTNSITPLAASGVPPNAYARRRGAMIGMLNSCDAVLAVSEFVRRKFESLGVDPGVISTMHIGTRAGELSRRHGASEPPPMTGPDGRRRPVRLVFLGFNNYAKGLPMLADALSLLVPEVQSRLHLAVHAHGGETIRHRFRRLRPRLAGLEFNADGYEFEDIPRLVAGHDLGVVPSVWWDNAPQTVFEFLACGVPVLGADIGGIPDFIRDGHNGVLFRANDRYDLARRLAEIVRAPGVLSELRANVRPPTTIEEHAAELIALYSALIRRRAASVVAAASGLPGRSAATLGAAP